MKMDQVSTAPKIEGSSSNVPREDTRSRIFWIRAVEKLAEKHFRQCLMTRATQLWLSVVRFATLPTVEVDLNQWMRTKN
jgi:hypothetical protein